MPGLGATTTTLQVGTYNALTDTFVQVLDLNDFATFWIEHGGVRFAQPKKLYVRSSNIRYQGENVWRYQYQNRHIQVSLRLRSTSTSGILFAIRQLLAAIEHPPYVLRIALPQGTQFSYADVVSVAHNIPSDPQALLAGVIPSIQIDFECKPGLRGDRVTLSNLVFNPGFEAPAGPGLTVFTDTFANVNAYAVQTGSAPTVAANVMTILNTARVAFGSPVWGAINQWSIRWQWLTGLTASFYLHYTNANNYLVCTVTNGTISIIQNVAGTLHTIATNTPTLVTATYYWLQLSQFPNVPGSAGVFVTANLYADAAGSISTAITNGAASGTTFDGVTALIGRPQIAAAGASLLIGGAFSNVHTMSLFGPGGWLMAPISGSATGLSSGAWDGLAAGAPTSTNANPYPNGPVTSYGCARIDLGPAGTLAANWKNYNGGTPAGTFAMPVKAPGDVLFASCWVETSGCGSGLTLTLQLVEYTSSGTLIQSDTLQTLTGNQASWVQMSGTVATQPTCAYAAIVVAAADATSTSFNGIVWIDNCMCYDQTATGMAIMPYCETRFPQSPAQLLISGVQGDIIAPAIVSLAGYFSSFTASMSAAVYLGRRNTSTAGIRFVQPSMSSSTSALDSTSYGGYSISGAPGPLIYSNIAESGAFHMLSRAQTANGTPTGVTVAPEVFTMQVPTNQATISIADTVLGAQLGSTVQPFTVQNTWTAFDAGQVIVPFSPLGVLQDPTQQAGYLSSVGGGSGGALLTSSYIALMPVDGELFTGSIYNPSGGSTVTTTWIYLYWDGTVPGAVSYSREAAPLPAPAHSIANQGPQSTNFTVLIASPAGQSQVMVDPQLATSLTQTGVNQWLLHITDSNAKVIPVAADIVYSPLYLFPR